MNRTQIARCYSGETDINTIAAIAETASGRRFLQLHNFSTVESAQRFADRVKAAGSIDEQHWAELDPVYGSEASADEQAEASLYAEGLRSGVIGEADVPENIRTLL
jgi:hypothetical protein